MSMRNIEIPIYVLARCCEAAAFTLDRLAALLSGLMPALLPPTQLSTRIVQRYGTVYKQELSSSAYDIGEESLEPWEATVLDQYQIRSGRMLIMGSGWGREALAVARRGITVVGVDTSFVAVQVAQQRACAAGNPAYFHQASFLELPYRPRSFDYAMLSSTMYSAIAGMNTRQAWLRSLGQQLEVDGLAILSFLPEQYPIPRTKAVCARLNAALSLLPGANRAYQPGDECIVGHFMHAFQSEEEVRTELAGAGALLKELNWARGYAVVSFPRPAHRS